MYKIVCDVHMRFKSFDDKRFATEAEARAYAEIYFNARAEGWAEGLCSNKSAGPVKYRIVKVEKYFYSASRVQKNQDGSYWIQVRSGVSEEAARERLQSSNHPPQSSRVVSDVAIQRFLIKE